MNNSTENRGENWALVKLLMGRYGPLALARAAGAVADAKRQGDKDLLALWSGVLNDLRHTICLKPKEA